MTSQHTYTVVVGVDGSPASQSALRWALWHANLLGGRVVAVQAWDIPGIYSPWVPGPEGFVSEVAKALSQTIDDAVGEGVVETHRVVHDHAARALLDQAQDVDADLLVVGNRGYGGFTGALIGSVSQHVVHGARCPVVVVREDQYET